MASSFRILRVQQTLSEEINSMIVMHKLKDPRVNSKALVMSVKVSHDTTCATIFVSGYLTKSQLTSTVVALNNARGFIQREIAKKYKFKNTPKLTFKMTDAIHSGEKVLKQIEKLSHTTDTNDTDTNDTGINDIDINTTVAIGTSAQTNIEKNSK